MSKKYDGTVFDRLVTTLTVELSYLLSDTPDMVDIKIYTVLRRLLSELNISRPVVVEITDTTMHHKIYLVLNKALRREISNKLYSAMDRSKMSLTPANIETVKELL